MYKLAKISFSVKLTENLVLGWLKDLIKPPILARGASFCVLPRESWWIATMLEY